MEAEIKHANIYDLPEILSLQKSAYLSEAALYNDYSIPPLLQTPESVKEEFERGIILKAVYANTIIGSVRAYEKGGTCHIGKLIVKDDFRNRGIGKRLMAAVEKEFLHCSRYELFTGDKSIKNISLYTKLGYNIFSRKTVSENLVLVFMEKSVVVQFAAT